MVKSLTAEVIYQTLVICGECPVWDEKVQRLYWTDLVNSHVYIFDPVNGANIGYNVGGVMGALVLCVKSGLMLASDTGFSFFDPATGSLEVKNDPESALSAHFFGDGKCDPQGRFWAGTYHQDIKDPVGCLYSLEADFSVKKRSEKMILPNGLAWSADHRKFYHIDSVEKCVYVCDYDLTSGEIGNRRILKRFDADRQLPDGMTIDTDGFLWIALYNSGKVVRVNPASGEIVFEVFVPQSRQVTSCTFGGRDFDELYITTAKEVGGPYGIPERELSSEKNAGALFRVKVPFRGLPAVRFRGSVSI